MLIGGGEALCLNGLKCLLGHWRRLFSLELWVPGVVLWARCHKFQGFVGPCTFGPQGAQSNTFFQALVQLPIFFSSSFFSNRLHPSIGVFEIMKICCQRFEYWVIWDQLWARWVRCLANISKSGLTSWAHNDSLSVVMGFFRIYGFETPNQDVAKHGNTVFYFYWPCQILWIGSKFVVCGRSGLLVISKVHDDKQVARCNWNFNKCSLDHWALQNFEIL
jgi:hypothetical protein